MPHDKAIQRNPVIQIILIGLVCLLGIGSRHYAHVLPAFISAYAGDTLWAFAAFLGIGLVLPRASTRMIAFLAITLSVAVEIASYITHPGSTRSAKRRSVGSYSASGSSGATWFATPAESAWGLP